MKNSILKIIFVLTFIAAFSCKDYLDIVPDNVATIDNAFSNRADAERYLYTCYSYLPHETDVNTNPVFYGGDESWIYWPIFEGFQSALAKTAPQIARGEQNANRPYMNYWDGDTGGMPLYKGIRVCNIFLENIDKVFDLDDFTRQRWKGEAQFLKAYYHFYLLRMYGPTAIVDESLPITASTDEVRISRSPVDKTVDYIAALLDSATVKLPLKIENKSSELGRVTKAIAVSIKAKLLVTAASPLFNGNSDYDDIKNADGVVLFNSTYDVTKWARAATACKEAIDICATAGHTGLFLFDNALANLNDTLKTEMSIRNSVCEKWNIETIWGYTGSTVGLQLQGCPRLDPTKTVNEITLGQLAPTMKIAEMFYSKNGVPILEDKTWDIANMYNTKTATKAHKNYLQPGYTTAGLHFDRESRFYANLAFDGSIWFMRNAPAQAGLNIQAWNIQAKYAQAQAQKGAFGYSVTGYFAKKLVNWKLEIQESSVVIEEYSFPIIRLADLYLLYAEALNEASGPSADVYTYLNKVRTRAGLKSVEDSWTNFSTNPTKYTTQSGLREIIHLERLIELALEGSRFWDLRRWKEALNEMSKPVYGWDITQETTSSYYRRKQLFVPTFVGPRDYLWPLQTNAIIVNRNLVQNSGW